MDAARIYYGDGSTYEPPPPDARERQAELLAELSRVLAELEALGGSPFAAPAHNVQCIRQGDGKQCVVRGKDYFVWLPERGWMGADLAGLLTSYFNRPGAQRVLVGATMPDSDAYWGLLKRAATEPL